LFVEGPWSSTRVSYCGGGALVKTSISGIPGHNAAHEVLKDLASISRPLH
jgi:hypothetical protein